MSPQKLTADQQTMWEQLDRELDPLISGGALSQALARLSAALQTLGSDEAMALLRARMHARRAELLLDLDDGDGAMQDARRAISLGLRDASSYGVAGWAAYHLDKPELARDYFDKALDVEPDEVTLLSGRALVFVDLEEFKLARADLTHALHQNDQDPEVLGMRGEVNLRLGDLEAAARDLEGALKLAPEDAEHALLLARLHLVKGKLEEALKVIDQAITDDDELALEAILLRSHLRLLDGQSRGARSDAIRASNLYPDEAFAFVQLAHVELAEGNLTLAKKAAERAVLLDPSLSDAYLVRGTAHQMAGNHEEARGDFERARRAPAELPVFLLGPAQELMEGQGGFGFDKSFMDMFSGAAPGFDPSAFAAAFDAGAKSGAAGKGPLPGMDPMGMLNQIFDDSGNVRGPLKPFFEMAFKNAPKIMKNLPPSMLGGIDKKELEDLDLSNLSSEEIEERMREFYQMMKAGKGPFGGPGNSSPDDEN